MSDTRAMQMDAMLLKGRFNSALPFRDSVLDLMKAVRSGCCWTTDEAGQFQVALGVLLLSKLTDDDKAWLDSQVDGLKKVSAILMAAQAGLALDLSSMDLPDESLQREYTLRDLWEESKPNG
jgi:hypothetical protein